MTVLLIRERRRFRTYIRKEGDVKMEADCSDASVPKKQQWLQATIKARRKAWGGLSLKSLRGTNPANNLISIYHILNGERMYFCCFKPPNIWYFVMSVLGDYYRHCSHWQSFDRYLVDIWGNQGSSAGNAKLDLKVHIPNLLDTTNFPKQSTTVTRHFICILQATHRCLSCITKMNIFAIESHYPLE